MDDSYTVCGLSVYGPRATVIGTLHKHSFKSIVLKREDIYDERRHTFGIPAGLYLALKKHKFYLSNVVIPVYREGVLLTKLKNLEEKGIMTLRTDGVQFIMMPESLWEFRLKDKLKPRQMNLFEKR